MSETADGRGKRSAGRRPRRAVCIFAAVVLGGLAAAGGLNWLVNPWGLYPPHLVKPRVVDQSYVRCALLRQFKPRPEQLVLGSSRMQCFEPERLQQRTGF